MGLSSHEQYGTIMGMSIPYTASGRVNQKARTRSALLQAARALLRDGVTPTVEQAAEAADISRTTAYRYFPNQRELLVAVHPEIDATSMLGDDPPSDPQERLNRVLDAIAASFLENEPELRAALRLSLETNGEREPILLRQGRAIGWLTDALEPLRRTLGSRKLRRLVLSIRATFGIDALVWLVDVAGCSREEAVALMRDSAMTLYRAATTGQPS